MLALRMKWPYTLVNEQPPGYLDELSDALSAEAELANEAQEKQKHAITAATHGRR